MKKKIVTLGLAVASVFMFSTTAFAAGWRQDSVGWWYQNDDGTYPQREWKWIDGNGDGVSECYYFDSNGYCMMNNVTPDGYVVNTSGAWIVKGVVQTQTSSQTQTGKSGKLTPEEKVYTESELLASITKQAPYIVREKVVADFNNDGKNEMVALMIDTHGQERGCTAYRWYSDGEHAFCFSEGDYWWLKDDEFVLIPTDDGIQLAENILWRQAGDAKEAYIYKFTKGKAHLMFGDDGFEFWAPSRNSLSFLTSEYDPFEDDFMPGGGGTFIYKNGKWQIGEVNAGIFGGTSGFYNEE